MSRVLFLLLAGFGLALAVGLVIADQMRPPPTVPDVDILPETIAATLESLVKVDDYPLYTMRYIGAYSPIPASTSSTQHPARLPHDHYPAPTWACSLFAALGDEDGMLYGRNFDWTYSPALLLFTDPPAGYASVSMVDIAYLVDASAVETLLDLPLVARTPLLYAPFLPFDGINEHGLAIGMAAVPGSDMPYDPAKEEIGSLAVMRVILDRARTVEEAVSVLSDYNVDMEGGPPLHYLIADRFGQAVLVEFREGEMVARSTDSPWHLATNFICTEAGDELLGHCTRYDAIHTRSSQAAGQLAPQQAIDLLEQVSQPGSTQWSVVYDMSHGDVRVAMGRNYEQIHRFTLEQPTGQPSSVRSAPRPRLRVAPEA